MGDVEDPYLYAAAPIHAWQSTNHGVWCMKHVQSEPEFWCDPDPVSFGYRVTIYGNLLDKDAVFHKLKWGHVNQLV
jgi:hypothetical protein